MEVRLSQNIKANRKRLGLTQEQLAEAMDVSVGTVSRIVPLYQDKVR